MHISWVLKNVLALSLCNPFKHQINIPSSSDNTMFQVLILFCFRKLSLEPYDQNPSKKSIAFIVDPWKIVGCKQVYKME